MSPFDQMNQSHVVRVTIRTYNKNGVVTRGHGAQQIEEAEDDGGGGRWRRRTDRNAGFDKCL